MGNNGIADKLKQLLDNMSQEEFDKSWDEVKQLGLVGPTVAEYLEGVTAGISFKEHIKIKK